MSELDEAWAMALAAAEDRARAAGRADLTEYLSLRNANDLKRTIGKDWLLDTFASLAAEANATGAAIQIALEDKHRFKVGDASMVGSSLSLGKGVRMLLVEVGWPRIPRDGFIRGGGLALAGIRHFGIRGANQILRLLLNRDGSPCWVVAGKVEGHSEIHEADLRKHITILLDDSRIRPPHH
ncbi:MAG: hypothetical protein H7Z16_01020 [Pyrinomonadaceae bacterium]|nr:hypothetical protein [Pyrinomonadaceae bacterium]